MVRQYFEDKPYSYAKGGEVDILKLYQKDTFSDKDSELIEGAIENGDIDTTDIKEDFMGYVYDRIDKEYKDEFETEDIWEYTDEQYENLLTHKENYQKLIAYLKDEDEYAEGGEAGMKFYVIDAKNGKLLSKGFDTEEEAKKEMYEIFDKSDDKLKKPFLATVKRKYEEGGEASKGLTKDEILSKYKGKYIDLLVGEDGKHIVKGVSNTPKSRYLLVEEWYEDLYAEGGEVQDWMEQALQSLIEETGNENLDITMVSNRGNEFFASNDMEEYRVFKSENDAEEIAVEQVRDDMEESPENFNKDFIAGYIDGRDFFEQSLNEMNRSYADDIASESDRKYGNRLIAEMVDNGLIDEDDAESDNADELAEEHIEDFVTLMTEGQLNEGGNGLDYFISNFGEEETMKMVIDNNLIDIDEASRDAVQTDGIGHFLSSYDGETLYLSDDYVAYRIN